MTQTLENDVPTGAIYGCLDNRWINEELFLELLQHFTQYRKLPKKEPIVLVLDNHDVEATFLWLSMSIVISTDPYISSLAAIGYVLFWSILSCIYMRMRFIHKG